MTLRAEAGSWPFWVDGEGYAIDPASLELPRDLESELARWTRRLTAADGWFEDEDERRRFDEEGRALWQCLTEQLRGRVAIGWQASFSDDAEAPLD